MITERTSQCLFLLCGQGVSPSELEQWRDEMTKALAGPEPGEPSVTPVSIVSAGVTSKAEHGFLLLQVHGGLDARSFIQWLGETARRHDFVAVPASDLFILFLKREEADKQALHTIADSPSPLAAFLAEAELRDETLAQTLGLVTKAVGNLEQDHLPRGEAFWQAMAAGLAVMKQVVDACLTIADDTCFRLPPPISDAVCAALMKGGVLLHHLRSRIDEVQLQLTAYRNRSSLAQRYLRQRQGVLQALRDLQSAGQDALKQSRVLRNAIQEYSSHTSSVTIAEATDGRQLGQRAGRTATARQRRTKNDHRGNRGTLLRLVTREEQKGDEL